MKKYLVEKVYSSNTKKDGSPLLGKDGKAFTRYSVKVADEWVELKGWGKEEVRDGDTIEAELEEKQGEGKWAGTTFRTLRLPKPDPSKDINELRSRIEKLEEVVFGADGPDDPLEIPF